jgi:hypothetical protein
VRSGDSPAIRMSTERYNAREAEPRWQKVWEERGIFATANSDPRPTYTVDYILISFAMLAPATFPSVLK